MGRGRFITLEGGDGAGKSTQVSRLASVLESRGLKVLTTREVGGAPGAEDIRHLWLSKPQGFWDPLTEVMLIMAARREHLAHTIWPALEAGVWVVSDRFVDSTRCYQGLGLGLGLDKVDAIYHEIAGNFWPDLTLILDLPVGEGSNRMNARKGPSDRYEQQDAEFHQKLRDGFLILADMEPSRLSVIDASRPVDEVAAALEARVLPLIEAAR